MRVPIADSGGRTIFGELAETHGFGHTKQKKVAYATAPGEDDEDDEEEDDEYEDDDEDEPEEGEHEHEHEPEADDAEGDEDVEYNDEEEDPEDTEDGDEPPPERAMKGKKKPVVVKKKKRVVYATAAESGAACYPLKPKQKYKKHPMKEAVALDRAYERILREADRGEFEEVPLDPFARPGLLAEHGTPGQKNYPHKGGKGGKRWDDVDDDTISRDDRHYERARKDALAGKYGPPTQDATARTLDYRQSDVAGSGRIERGPATPETSAKAIRQNVGSRAAFRDFMAEPDRKAAAPKGAKEQAKEYKRMLGQASRIRNRSLDRRDDESEDTHYKRLKRSLALY